MTNGHRTIAAPRSSLPTPRGSWDCVPSVLVGYNRNAVALTCTRWYPWGPMVGGSCGVLSMDAHA